APLPDDATKAKVTCGCIDWVRVTRRRPITTAVVGCAEMRAAFDDLARNPEIGLAGVVACTFGPAARVLRNAARLRRVGFGLWGIRIGGQCPDIADHVVEAVAVCREGGDRRGTLVAIQTEILAGKDALPGVGHLLSGGRELIAPCELLAIETAAGRE